MTAAKRGRPKGALNKITNEAKKVMLMALDEIGGAERLAKWIKADPANETLWWTRMVPKLLPRPALDVVPDPKPPRPVPGVLTWKTPDWVKLLDRKEELLAGISEGACAFVDAAKAGGSGPPDEDRPPGRRLAVSGGEGGELRSGDAERVAEATPPLTPPHQEEGDLLGAGPPATNRSRGRRGGGRALDVAYEPRRQFVPLHLDRPRWTLVVAHRRAGKTVACIAELIRSASLCERKDARFAYVAPQLNQAKDIAWHYLLEHSESFADGRRVNQSELWIELPGNGARVRLYGADNPDRLRGLYLDGVVLDEYGDMEPGVWTRVIRPLLSDREGWAIFIGTPKGRNGFWRLWRDADGQPDWLRLTLKASATGLLSAKELADVRRTLDDDEYAQEYECSFEAAVRGAYWGKEIAALEAAGQIGAVPFDPALRVHTAWDLGMANSTVIWLIQAHHAAGQYRVIDVIRGEGVALAWYVDQIERSRERHGRAGGTWLWGDHILPHDAAVRELGTGKSRIEALAELGLVATLCPGLPVEDGIQAVRRLLPRCWFDRERCAKGLEALGQYRRDYDEKRQEYRLRPLHDWTSHYADALRYFAVGYRPPHPSTWRKPKRNVSWVV